jgi:hypothetical protein
MIGSLNLRSMCVLFVAINEYLSVVHSWLSLSLFLIFIYFIVFAPVLLSLITV